jgi:hypothetical protein
MLLIMITFTTVIIEQERKEIKKEENENWMQLWKGYVRVLPWVANDKTRPRQRPPA